MWSVCYKRRLKEYCSLDIFLVYTQITIYSWNQYICIFFKLNTGLMREIQATLAIDWTSSISSLQTKTAESTNELNKRVNTRMATLAVDWISSISLLQTKTEKKYVHSRVNTLTTTLVVYWTSSISLLQTNTPKWTFTTGLILLRPH